MDRIDAGLMEAAGFYVLVVKRGRTDYSKFGSIPFPFIVATFSDTFSSGSRFSEIQPNNKE